ncbi:MAG: CHAD domain-containing protein [Nitrospirae bacterium]|nr:MAG: CHAD domain-containing protein [Nitrospirota bacterium]
MGRDDADRLCLAVHASRCRAGRIRGDAGAPVSPLTAIEPGAVEAVEKRAALYYDHAVGFARALRTPPFHPETVHRLRTHLRRLQAYAELLQRPKTASSLAKGVTRLSRLRTLDVFHRYLRRRRGAAEDSRRVAWALREEETKVAHAGYVEAIRTLLERTSLARMRRPDDFLEVRFESLNREHADRLRATLRGLSAEAKRKELHRLRLLVKAFRYQEEIALETSWGSPQAVAALKRLQRTLGDYCDRDQFRRLAKKMKLACRVEMQKEYRRYRKRARAAVRRLGLPETAATGPR